MWGSAVGALPFVILYILPLLTGHALPYAEYTAVLLGCIPLAFASAIVRYRLMDIEVIIKKALVVAAVVLLLVVIYDGMLKIVGLTLGTDENRSSFWALLATLVGRAGRAVAVERDSERPRSALLQGPLRLPQSARELRARAEQRSRSRTPELAARRARIRDTLGVDKIAAVSA